MLLSTHTKTYIGYHIISYVITKLNNWRRSLAVVHEAGNGAK